MVEFRWPTKVCLFLSSYVPLFLILAIELHRREPAVVPHVPVPGTEGQFPVSLTSILLLLFSVLLIIFLAFLVIYHSGHKIDEVRCENFKQRNELLSSYLLVYVFVFVGLNFSSITDWLIFAIFFAMLAVLQMRSEMLHINPLLGIAGFRVYEVKSENRTLLVISKNNIRESIKIPESQKNVSDPSYRNLEVIQLGPSTYMTPRKND